MKILTLCIVAGVSFAAPGLAFAQSGSDSTYCTALSHQYTKYVSNPNDKNPMGTPADVGSAMGKCQSADASSAIPVLEKALKDQKVPLPPRS